MIYHGEHGESKPTFYFDVHGEINNDKTIKLARERARLMGDLRVGDALYGEPLKLI